MRSTSLHTKLGIFKHFNTLGLGQKWPPFSKDIFKCISLNENIWISIEISLKLVPRGPVNNIPALVQIMAWRRPGDKPLSEPMMFNLLIHTCITRPQWVKLKPFQGSTKLTKQPEALTTFCFNLHYVVNSKFLKVIYCKWLTGKDLKLGLYSQITCISSSIIKYCPAAQYNIQKCFVIHIDEINGWSHEIHEAKSKYTNTFSNIVGIHH